MGCETIYMGIMKCSVLLFSLVFHELGHAWNTSENNSTENFMMPM